MSSFDIRPSGQGEINYGNPLLTPLVFRALNPLGVGLDFTREEVRNRAQHVSKDYVLTMEALALLKRSFSDVWVNDVTQYLERSPILCLSTGDATNGIV